MRVLIIGCGYIGLPLGAEFVRHGHEVHGLRRNPDSQLAAAGITPLLADITKPAALANLSPNYDWLINCVSSSGGGPDDYRAIYLEGTKNLLHWLSKTPPSKFVYTSSTSVYGQNDGSLVDEASPAQPDAETAKILVATEKLLLDAAAQSFPAIILRLAGIYGPGRGYWLKQFLSNEARLDDKGDRIMNMVHRDDVVRGIIAALERGRPGQIYNLVDDEPVTQFEFFKWLAKTTGREMPPASPATSPHESKRGITNKNVSNQKLKHELLFNFHYPTFREGSANLLKIQ